MNKKVFIIGVFIVILMVLTVPKGNSYKVGINNKKYSESSKYKIAIEYLKEKANDVRITNYNDGNKGEMYTFSHETTNQTSIQTDYRYIGDNPNNYVYFNCDDNGNNCEIWRIIGVFSVDDGNGNYEQRIKLVRGSAFSNPIAWDSNGLNDWTNASLNKFLNDDFFNKSKDASSYGLNNLAKEMIADSVYYLGALNEYSDIHYGSVEHVYNCERGNNLCGACENDLSKLNWLGKVGLMYPSDIFMTYAYGVNTICYNDPGNCDESIANLGWIYNSNKFESDMSTPNTMWLMASSLNDDEVFDASISGYLGTFPSDGTSYGVRPVVYLKNDLIITNGDGSIENPYKIISTKDYISNLDYKIGDKVYYNNELYRVINYSSINEDYITVLKDDFLKNKYTDYFNDWSAGSLPYFESENCYYHDYNNYDDSICSTNFNVSTVKRIIDDWAANELDLNDLVSVDGYKVRLVTADELIENLAFDSALDISNEIYYKPSELSPAFIKNSNYNTWTMSSKSDDGTVYYFNNSLSNSKVYNMLEVKPVINLKKKYSTDIYNIGDEITYKDNKYYVIANSNSNINYVTVIKDKSLTKKQILKYGNFVDRDGYIKYINCDNDDCIRNYDNSNIKTVIEYWLSENFDEEDLVSVDGYKARLLSMNDLFKKWDLKKNYNENYYRCDNCADWLNKDVFVLMDTKDNNIGYMFNSYGRYIQEFSLVDLEDGLLIRPVVNLKKSAVNKYKTNDLNNTSQNSNLTCVKKYKKIKNTKYNIYKVGQEINYKGDNYYVINISSNKENYVTLLREKFLTYHDIDSNNLQDDNSFVYYKSNECMSSNKNGCINDYNSSNVKKVIDTWLQKYDIDKDLIEVDGYKARLLTIDELFDNLGYDFYNKISMTSLYRLTNDVFEWIYDKNTSYWTMTGYEDDNSIMFIVNKNGDVGYQESQSNNGSYVFNSYAIRPVINLDKCAIGGCSIEEIEVEDGCIDDVNNNSIIVNVANTLKYLPQILIIISIILIIGGCGVLGYNYIKSRKERK